MGVLHGSAVLSSLRDAARGDLTVNWSGRADSNLSRFAGESESPQAKSHPHEHGGLSSFLNAFGNGDESQAMAQAHDSRNDLPPLTVVQHGTHEGHVDLDLVERKGLQVVQAGIARFKIIERKPHPRAAICRQKSHARNALITRIFCLSRETFSRLNMKYEIQFGFIQFS